MRPIRPQLALTFTAHNAKSETSQQKAEARGRASWRVLTSLTGQSKLDASSLCHHALH